MIDKVDPNEIWDVVRPRSELRFAHQMLTALAIQSGGVLTIDTKSIKEGLKYDLLLIAGDPNELTIKQIEKKTSTTPATPALIRTSVSFPLSDL